MAAKWNYSIDREVLLSEQFGWIPHCVPYRERERTRSDIRYGVYSASSQLVPQPVETDYGYMLDRNNSDRRGDADNGGNLRLYKSKVKVHHGPLFMKEKNGSSFKGYLPVNRFRDSASGAYADTTFPPVASDVQLDALGASFVNRALPTLPSASLGQTLVELKRGLPRHYLRTFQSLKGMDKNAADDFLNFVFGWKPLIADIAASIKSLRASDEKLEQLYRDNGRPVRRRIDLPPQVTSEVRDASGVSWTGSTQVGILGLCGLGDGKYVTTTTVTDYFSGSFVYHIPLGKDFQSKLARFNAEADYLLGLSLSPELLWEVAPWSWLVDWFTNVGDVISNISRMGNDGTVMRYGYVCREVRKVLHLTGRVVPSSFWFPNGISGDTSISQSWEYKRVYRRRANPYGFGVTFESLSGLQLAILAALGISKRQARGG